jgi:acyl-CoA synthetase (AMP-forming)/AMP-acid ligase II
MTETLLASLEQPATRDALREPGSGDRLSYGALGDVVVRIARQLAAAGVKPGDAVAFACGNGPEPIVLLLATAAANAAAAPLNPAYTAAELVGYLEDIRPRLLVLRGEEAPGARPAAKALAIPTEELVGARAGELALAGVRGAAALPTPDPEAVALLLHTSGTTSRPKLVPIRQCNLVASAHNIAATYGLGPADVSHCVMPLFHVHGLVGSTLAPLASGGSVLTPRRFSATSFWEESVGGGATWFSAVPTIHQVLLARAVESCAPPHTLRFARSSSSALPGAVLAEFEERFGVPLVEAFSMTEASHQMTTNPLPPGERRATSVGLPAGTEIAIVDDAWRPLPAGVPGEVTVRGPGVVDGYRGNPEANAASFREGWFRTGDSGFLAGDGYLTLVGRIKELINRGGEKVSPYEVEAVLLEHTAVSEAAVFAVPDAKYGECVAAVVVAHARVSEDELARHCAERLASFKVPARIVLADAIPKGATGKVQRRNLASALGL